MNSVEIQLKRNSSHLANVKYGRILVNPLYAVKGLMFVAVHVRVLKKRSQIACVFKRS